MNKPSLSTSDVKDTISAAQQISNYAQAAVTLVPNLTDIPQWYKQISVDITTTKDHAQNWLDVLCPDATLHLPRTITAFNPTFQSNISKIQSILSSAENGNVSAEQKTQINNLFDSILSALKVQQNVTDSITKKLKDFIVKANADQATLSNDLNTIKSNDQVDADGILAIQSVMTDHFMNNTILGPCNVIVSLDINVSIKINQINSKPHVLAYAFISQFVDHMISNIKAIQVPLQSFYDLWNTMILDYQTVIEDLNSASADDYVNVIESLDLNQAKKDWQALADFVKQSLPQEGHSIINN
ncbi:hypothetical protein [uncultured Psychroserpens sp.]|uniref:hypothetical protein n=1 Tax=uncultured Psychroserpens sp. TaxID=255436 RepID=UPI00262FAC6F|nr:hypothetical protein [uncultured Psychroserpens sp.]